MYKMAIIHFDRNANQFAGLITYFFLEGQFHIPFWEQLRDDINNITFNIPQTRFGIFTHAVAYLNVITDLSNFPFYSFPEPRYKLGSYGFTSLQTIQTDVEGNVQAFPISRHPEYIVYAQQELGEFSINLTYPTPTVTDYEIAFISPTENLVNEVIVGRFRNSTTLPNYPPANGIYLNLVEGIQAEMSIYYEGVTAPIPNSEVRTGYISVL